MNNIDHFSFLSLIFFNVNDILTLKIKLSLFFVNLLKYYKNKIIILPLLKKKLTLAYKNLNNVFKISKIRWISNDLVNEHRLIGDVLFLFASRISNIYLRLLGFHVRNAI
ncbi:hypothetical protein EAE89_17750 [Photorhabdus heterorhabditis]|uniref:Uncharacterized protein n=1 Tax=Photorhabdus heterorhabditis TaxID=880156 RepID=A0ABR5KBV5_9GAMM|nr:hypothetical protein AM629_10635 [Photorhabdus heterorhabditis]MBS9443461.1 hypothetical protein [Photorhabdus heterorhabditis]